MKPANLLINPESLRFEAEKDLSLEIDNAFKAYEKARDNDDKFFNSPEIWQMKINGHLLIEAIVNAKLFFPWLRPNHKKLILNLMHRGTSPQNAKSFEELEAEYPNENNGDFAFGDNGNDKCVFGINSWYRLHAAFLTAFPEYIDWTVNKVLILTEYSNLKIREVVENETNKKWNIEEAIEHFNKELIRKFRENAGDLIELAEEIAHRNCYNKNPTLTAKERKLNQESHRLVFEIIKNKKKQYLSLDFENGQFEVCDDSGTQIGVWNFSGEKTEEADESGGHDLKSLKK